MEFVLIWVLGLKEQVFCVLGVGVEVKVGKRLQLFPGKLSYNDVAIVRRWLAGNHKRLGIRFIQLVYKGQGTVLEVLVKVVILPWLPDCTEVSVAAAVTEAVTKSGSEQHKNTRSIRIRSNTQRFGLSRV